MTQGFLNNAGTAWADYQVSRTYDLAGHTLAQNYPSGRSVTNSYSVSGRLNSFSGNIGDGTSRTYADTLSYHPAGMITKERFATQTNLYHNSRYNKRLQMVETRLGKSSNDPFVEENLTGCAMVRTTGYAFQAADGVRQKHTGKERDGETGMDYFVARYFSNIQVSLS